MQRISSLHVQAQSFWGHVRCSFKTSLSISFCLSVFPSQFLLWRLVSTFFILDQILVANFSYSTHLLVCIKREGYGRTGRRRDFVSHHIRERLSSRFWLCPWLAHGSGHPRPCFVDVLTVAGVCCHDPSAWQGGRKKKIIDPVMQTVLKSYVLYWRSSCVTNMLVDWLDGTKNLLNKLYVTCFSTYLL